MKLSDDRVSLVYIHFYFLYLSLSFLTSPDVGLSLFSYLEKKPFPFDQDDEVESNDDIEEVVAESTDNSTPEEESTTSN